MTTTSKVPQSLFRETPHFKTIDITSVNHKPHPYCIGVKHVHYASDHCGGILDTYTICEAEKSGAACETCKNNCRTGRQHKILSYHEHTSDKVLVIEVENNSDLNTIDGLKDFLMEIQEEAKKEKIDGFIFPKKGQYNAN